MCGWAPPPGLIPTSAPELVRVRGAALTFDRQMLVRPRWLSDAVGDPTAAAWPAAVPAAGPGQWWVGWRTAAELPEMLLPVGGVDFPRAPRAPFVAGTFVTLSLFPN